MWGGGGGVGASFLLFIFLNDRFLNNVAKNICRVLTLETFRGDSEGSHIVTLPMSTYNKCLLYVSLPLGAIGWSVVCDCGIFWAYNYIYFFLSQDSKMVSTVSTLNISSAHLP